MIISSLHNPGSGCAARRETELWILLKDQRKQNCLTGSPYGVEKRRRLRPRLLTPPWFQRHQVKKKTESPIRTAVVALQA